MSETTIQQTVEEAYAVDPVLCIACDACCQDFPEVFYMGGDEKAHAHDVHPTDLYNPRKVIDVCPTAAISFSGEVPPPEDLAQLDEVDGWELEWARWRGVEEDLEERDRRYGRDYTLEEDDDTIRITVRLPRRVPAVRDRFRYGLDTEMPRYRTFVERKGQDILIAGWLTDPKIKALTHTSKSFPSRFMTTLELKADTIGFVERYDSKAELHIVLFKNELAMQTWQWESHFITDKCTACTICERVCPTNAITPGQTFFIDPDLCINCSVCGVYCPFDAIDDSNGVTVQRIKAKQIPKALVHEDLCTGCEFCVDVCPFEALAMRPADADTPEDMVEHLPQNLTVAYVIEKNCVSCKLCEQVCIKDAIEVPRQHQFEDIGMSFMSYVTDGH